MSNVFEASTGYRVDRRTDGVLRITGPRGLFVSSPDLSTAVAEYVDDQVAKAQAARDEELGRWRFPENPDYVVYPRDGETVMVVRESDGTALVVWRRNSGHGSAVGVVRAARAYFDAHPKRMPWDDAKPGEVWLLTLLDKSVGPVPAMRTRDYWCHHDADGDFRTIAHNEIDIAHRLWPVVQS